MLRDKSGLLHFVSRNRSSSLYNYVDALLRMLELGDLFLCENVTDSSYIAAFRSEA